MRIFETRYKSLYQRLFNIKNAIYLEFFILLAPSIYVLKPVKPYLIIFEILLLMIFIVLVINNSKTNILIITLDENNIKLEGETFNEKWKKSINIKETEIILKGKGSKTGICGATFYIQLKNKKHNFYINRFETFSDSEIIEIFNEFKKLKKEKIIIDEKISLNRIQEKIEKCQ